MEQTEINILEIYENIRNGICTVLFLSLNFGCFSKYIFAKHNILPEYAKHIKKNQSNKTRF